MAYVIADPSEIAAPAGRGALWTTVRRHPTIVAGEPRIGGSERILGDHLTTGRDR